ncbi:MAG: AAA family ATPase, partial [Bacteroidales bacterium]|nr:AAA family ATPase [Bacteroidales bacterium]
MLSHLYIENYVLIDKIDIDFSKGLSVISGETGSGKSILLGALGLILGQRADTQVLLDKNKKCIIEGHFNIKNYNLSDFYNNNELDYEENTILRREINNKGKSRAFINDTPVTLNLMKELGERLVDIHSQHKTLEINESDFQLAVIDEYANNKSLLKEYRINLAAYKKLILQYKELEEKTRQAKIESDYWQFLFNELDNAEIKEGEQEELEKELEIQNNAELIKKQLFEATNYLTESENNIEGTLSIIINNLNKLGNSLTSVQDFKQRIESARIELSDISKEMGIINDKINYNPERINHISENLDYIYHLHNKHNVKTISELIEIKNQLSDKLNNI